MVRKLMGGLLVSIVSLWFAAFEGWAGKQINRKGSLKLHCATFGIPKMKEHRFTFHIHILNTRYFILLSSKRYNKIFLMWIRNTLKQKLCGILLLNFPPKIPLNLNTFNYLFKWTFSTEWESKSYQPNPLHTWFIPINMQWRLTFYLML